MAQNPDNHVISILLRKWYENNKRDLPWRETRDPYRIWISEIILQQTRVNQGYDYFLRFIRQFPDVQSLASASEQSVLKQWQGLGYYSRARNLHAAAKQIQNHFNGIFPDQYEQVLSLKGIGEYTAAAIMSIAHNQPFAVVDGNVNRVVARLFKVEEPINSTKGKKIIAEIAQSLIDEQQPGIHNQAMMDFGALICTPQRPKCTECPLQEHCWSFADSTVSTYPVKLRSKKVRDRYFNYFHIIHGNNTFLHKRTDADIWKNLYEFPLIETDEKTSLADIADTELFKEWFRVNGPVEFSHKSGIRHVLSHQNIHAEFYRVDIHKSACISFPTDYIRIPIDKIGDYPVSQLIHKYLELFT